MTQTEYAREMLWRQTDFKVERGIWKKPCADD